MHQYSPAHRTCHEAFSDNVFETSAIKVWAMFSEPHKERFQNRVNVTMHKLTIDLNLTNVLQLDSMLLPHHRRAPHPRIVLYKYPYAYACTHTHTHTYTFYYY